VTREEGGADLSAQSVTAACTGPTRPPLPWPVPRLALSPPRRTERC